GATRHRRRTVNGSWVGHRKADRIGPQGPHPLRKHPQCRHHFLRAPTPLSRTHGLTSHLRPKIRTISGSLIGTWLHGLSETSCRIRRRLSLYKLSPVFCSFA